MIYGHKFLPKEYITDHVSVSESLFGFDSVIYNEYCNYKSLLESCNVSEKESLQTKVDALYEASIKDITSRIIETLKNIKDFFLALIKRIKEFLTKHNSSEVERKLQSAKNKASDISGKVKDSVEDIKEKVDKCKDTMDKFSEDLKQKINSRSVDTTTTSTNNDIEESFVYTEGIDNINDYVSGDFITQPADVNKANEVLRSSPISKAVKNNICNKIPEMTYSQVVDHVHKLNQSATKSIRLLEKCMENTNKVIDRTNSALYSLDTMIKLNSLAITSRNVKILSSIKYYIKGELSEILNIISATSSISKMIYIV